MGEQLSAARYLPAQRWAKRLRVAPLRCCTAPTPAPAQPPTVVWCPGGTPSTAGLVSGVRGCARLAADTPTVEAARGAGFMPALVERLWTRSTRPATSVAAPANVREAEEADAYFEFQLYGAALPFEARRALGAEARTVADELAQGHLREAVLNAAHAYERATEWHRRRPPEA